MIQITDKAIERLAYAACSAADAPVRHCMTAVMDAIRLELNAIAAQEAKATAWQAHDLEVGKSYESWNFGLVNYLGVDDFYGEKTHAFEVGRMQRRYWKTEKLGEFLKPKIGARP
ncbi:hypothetical protein GOC16_08395 [Sinorhizobium meliloti]|nr:hypothetical protein [Sinorhizobium meliloti]